MGIDDLVNKGKDFLTQNKDALDGALHSERAEQASDTTLDAAAEFVKRLTPDEHDAKVDDVRDRVDRKIGTEGSA